MQFVYIAIMLALVLALTLRRKAGEFFANINLKTIPDGISPVEVQEKMAAGLTQDQAVDVISKQHEYDLKHPNVALKRIEAEQAKRDADAKAADRRKKEAEEAGKEHAKSEKTAAQQADKEAKEEADLAEELTKKANEKREAELKEAAEAKKATDEAETGEAELEDMTVAELRDLAEKRDVDLTGITLKSDIIAELKKNA